MEGEAQGESVSMSHGFPSSVCLCVCVCVGGGVWEEAGEEKRERDSKVRKV